MKRLLALLALFVIAALSCAHIQPVVNTVVVCSGETVPAALVEEVYTDIMTENWGDLAMAAVPALKAGWDDIACIYDALKAKNPQLVPHMNKLKSQHLELRVALAACAGRRL